MSEQFGNSKQGLVPAGRRDLTPVADANPLVSRGLSAVSKVEVNVQVKGAINYRPKDAVRTGWWAGWRPVADTPSAVQIYPNRHYKLCIERPHLQRGNFVQQLAELAGVLPLWSLEIDKNREPRPGVGEVLARFRTLRELMLYGWYEALTDADLAPLAGLRELEYLSLDGADHITDEGLSHLRGLTELRELDLTTCRSITDQGLSHFHQLKKLQQVQLGLNDKLTGAGVAALRAALPQCTIRGWHAADQ